MANCWRSARFSRTRSESFWGPKSMFKSSLSSIFIMDADFAGLVEKVNNFSVDGIFASDSHNMLCPLFFLLKTSEEKIGTANPPLSAKVNRLGF